MVRTVFRRVVNIRYLQVIKIDIVHVMEIRPLIIIDPMLPRSLSTLGSSTSRRKFVRSGGH